MFGTGGKALAAFLAASTALAGAAHTQYVAHTAPITGPVGSHPFNAAAYKRVPQNLATFNPPYVEREYTLSGLANVYKYNNPSSTTDDSVSLIQSLPLPYVNRILVRAPTNPSAFSGNVIVEVANDALVSDNETAWSYASSYFTNHGNGQGDAYILLTSQPAGLATLKAYNPTRYRALNWPTAAATNTKSCTNGSLGEGGIIYDQITELGNLLKANNGTGPLAGYNVRHLLITGYSGSAEILLTYDRVFGLNSPLYDGYFVAAGGFRAPLNDCEASSTGLDRTEPPASTKSAVFQVQTESELLLAALKMASIPKGTDSDTASSRYRYYEIAGSSHVNGDLVRGSPERADFPSPAYLTDLTQAQARTECNEPSNSLLSSFPDRYVYDAMWANLEAWTANGTAYKPPVEASTINIGAVLLGEQIGGVRSPAVDFPTETYTPGSAAPSGSSGPVQTLCGLLGYQVPNGSTLNAAGVKADAAMLAAQGFMTAIDASAVMANPNLAYTYPDGTDTVPD